MTGEEEEGRLYSNNDVHFGEAYERRPLLNILVWNIHVATWMSAAAGLWLLFTGRVRHGLGWLVIAVAAFLAWSFLHNWALTHSRSKGSNR